MRFFGVVGCATIVLAVLLVALLAVIDGYFGQTIFPDWIVPDAWAAPDSWSEWRDIVIVISGFFWALAALLTVVLVAALIFVALTVRKLLNNNAAPAIDALKLTLDNARGTTEFVGETIASPIIRLYSVFSGVRAGARALGAFPNRVSGRKKGRRQ